MYISACWHSSGDTVLNAEKEIKKGVCKEFVVIVYVCILTLGGGDMCQYI